MTRRRQQAPEDMTAAQLRGRLGLLCSRPGTPAQEITAVRADLDAAVAEEKITAILTAARLPATRRDRLAALLGPGGTA